MAALLLLGKEVPSALPVRVTKPEATRSNGWMAAKRVTMNGNDSSMANTFALLDRMKSELPEIWSQAQVVGKWVWLEFSIPPLVEIRAKLKALGFHWNGKRKCWQHPCGFSRPRAGHDPKSVYQVQPAQQLHLVEEPPKESKA